MQCEGGRVAGAYEEHAYLPSGRCKEHAEVSSVANCEFQDTQVSARDMLPRGTARGKTGFLMSARHLALGQRTRM